MRRSNYDKFPCVDVPGTAGRAWRGWAAIAARLRDEVSRLQAAGNQVVVIECYTGVHDEEIRAALRPVLPNALWLDSQGLADEARGVWRRVASERPDDPMVKKLAGP